MSTIVVYQSETGFTKKYAEWIAEALDCEAVPFKKVNETKKRTRYGCVFLRYEPK